MRIKRIEETERIVDIHHISATEMVAIVVILQVVVSLLQGPTVHFCHSFQFWLEVLSDFFFCNTANCSMFWKETDIGQVVEYREKRNLRKLGNTRNEDETLIRIIGFQNGKNASIYFCTTLMLGSFPRVLERRVVLIDKNGNLELCLLIGGF